MNGSRSAILNLIVSTDAGYGFGQQLATRFLSAAPNVTLKKSN
ncbi:hypothetical protein ACIQWI_07900 [Peribacillus frigoritolerans]